MKRKVFLLLPLLLAFMVVGQFGTSAESYPIRSTGAPYALPDLCDLSAPDANTTAVDTAIRLPDSTSFPLPLLYHHYLRYVLPYYQKQITEQCALLDQFRQQMTENEKQIQLLSDKRTELWELENTPVDEPSPKDEFETTAHYESRIKNYQQEVDHRSKLMRMLESQISDLGYFETSMVAIKHEMEKDQQKIEQFKKYAATESIPGLVDSVVSSINYNADKQRFSLMLGQSKWWVKVPIRIAPEFKKSVNEWSVYYYEEYTGYPFRKINPKFMIVFKDKIYHLHGYVQDKNGNDFEVVNVGPYQVLADDQAELKSPYVSGINISEIMDRFEEWRIPDSKTWDQLMGWINWKSESGRLVLYDDIDALNLSTLGRYLCLDKSTDRYGQKIYCVMKTIRKEGILTGQKECDPLSLHVMLRLVKR